MLEAVVATTVGVAVGLIGVGVGVLDSALVWVGVGEGLELIIVAGEVELDVVVGDVNRMCFFEAVGEGAKVGVGSCTRTGSVVSVASILSKVFLPSTPFPEKIRDSVSTFAFCRSGGRVKVSPSC